MRKHLVLVICSAVAGGCGSSDVGDNGQDVDSGPGELMRCENSNGTRLTQIIREHSDGSREVVAFYDHELQVECSFENVFAVPGLFCRPKSDFGQLVHTDPACTEPAVGVSQESSAKFVYQITVDGLCLADTQYFEVQDEITPSTVYVKSDDGNCFEISGGDYRYHRYVEFVAEDFVGGSDSWNGSGRLRTRQIDADDGATVCDASTREPMKDQENGGRTCRPRRDENDVLRCMPTDSRFTSTSFTDSSCETQVDVLRHSPECGSGFAYAFVRDFDACPATTRPFLVGEASDEPLYFLQNDTCELDDGLFAAFGLGSPVDPSAFAEVESTTDTPGDRLDRTNNLGDGVIASRTTWSDPVAGGKCRFRADASGDTEYCVPLAGSVTDVADAEIRFSDDACSEQVLVAEMTESCRTEPRFAVTPLGEDLAVYEIGAELEKPFYRDLFGDCQLVEGGMHWELGTEVPLTEFVSGTRSIEPMP